MVKLNEDGTTDWQRSYGSLLTYIVDSAEFIRQTSDLGYIVTGYSNIFSQTKDIWVFKLNPDGTVAWEWVYGGQYDEEALCVRETTDPDGFANGFIVAGSTESLQENPQQKLISQQS